jgi:CRISPR-associated protein Cas2
MSVTVVVTRNVPDRYRGFLSSSMLEIAPGVYITPSMSRGARDRVWDVMLEWCALLPTDGGVLMTYPDANAPAGQEIRVVGFPKASLVEHDGIWLACRDVSTAEAAATPASD